MLDDGDILAPQYSTHSVSTLHRMFPQPEGVNHSHSEQSLREVQGTFESICIFPSLEYKTLYVSGATSSLPIPFYWYVAYT